MSKVIFKSPYTKSGGHAGQNVKYIAKREGVDISINTKIIMNNLDYIANRPRVIKIGEHGLFGQEDDMNLEKVEGELKNFRGIVWQPVISLRREDAERLGFNNPQKWRTYLRSKQVEIANTYRIPIDDLVWYGAYHNEGDHPHIHMIIYNKNPGSEYLTNKNINDFRTMLTKDIFKDELKQLYDERQSLRDKIIEETKETIQNFSPNKSESTGAFAEKYLKLQFVLGGYTGTKKYKYLSPEQKNALDDVLNEVCKNENIQNLYAQWQQMQLAILGYYSKKTRLEYEKLSEDKNFYRMKNAILQTIVCNNYYGYTTDNTQTTDDIYGNIVYSLCQMIQKASREQTEKMERHYSKSIVDSKEKKKHMQQSM